MGIYRKKVDLAEIAEASTTIGLETALTLSDFDSPFFKAIGELVSAYFAYETTPQDKEDLTNAQLALGAEQNFDLADYIAEAMGKAKNQKERIKILNDMGNTQTRHESALNTLQERIEALTFKASHSALNAMENAIMSGRRKNGASTTVKDLTNKVLAITFPRKGYFFRIAVIGPNVWNLYQVDNATKTVDPLLESKDLSVGDECGSMSKARKICAAYINYHSESGEVGIRQAFSEGFKDFNQGGVSNVKVLEMPADQWMSQAEGGDLPE